MNLALIAHRGGTDRYPELTIEAARYSLQAGADYVELDIRFTKDNVPVISHDQDALRLFGSPAKISELTAEQYTGLRYVSDPLCRPYTLDEVLASGVQPIVIHMKKGGGALVQVLERIRAHHCENKMVMGVTSPDDVTLVKAFNPGIAVLAFLPAREQAAEFIRRGADVIRLWEDWTEEEAVRRIHDAGKQVWVMTGSPVRRTVGFTKPEHFSIWKKMGADGVLVDEVVKTKALLTQEQ